MPSADFCLFIPSPLDDGSTWQTDRSPWVRQVTSTLMPAAFTSLHSVQVSVFEEYRLLNHPGCLICGFCSPGQRFASGLLPAGDPGIRLAAGTLAFG